MLTFELGPDGAVDEEVDGGVDPQQQVVGAGQAEEDGWGREKPSRRKILRTRQIRRENLPHLILFSTMKSSPTMRMTLSTR